MGASTAGKLLVTLCLRLCAITTGNRRSASGLRYYPLDWEAFFVVLISPVDRVMPLQEISSRLSDPVNLKELEMEHIPSSKTHVAGEALKRLDIGVCSFESDQLEEQL